MCKKEQSDQMKLIIIFITYLLGGVVDAVCGGGGLITLPVLFAIGVPAHIAVGTNQTSILPGVITSVVKFHKSGKIDIKCHICSTFRSYWGFCRSKAQSAGFRMVSAGYSSDTDPCACCFLSPQT